MVLSDTIAAAATAPGRSARAIVRLSGPATRRAMAAVLDRAPPDGPAVARIGPGLPVLVTRFAAPRSYTGQDAAELMLPGNPALVERLMSALLAVEGVRAAGPGEFTARAYLNGRLSLAQGEAIAWTIAARTEEELRGAAELMSGRTGQEYRAWSDQAATLLALTEAGIDFADQEGVVSIEPGSLGARARAISAALGRHLGAAAGARAERSLARVVLAGEPNAGKSTLFNALLGRERAVVSPVCGTTRDALEEELDLSRDAPGAGPVLLIDAAGVDAGPGRGIDAAARARAAEAVAGADVLLHCDPGARFGTIPGRREGVATIRVRTKADVPGPDGTDDEVAVCALDGWNLGTLRRAIADAACAGTSSVLPRHRRALASARAALDEAATLAEGGAGAELIAVPLRAALDALGELTGRISPDDVLGRVFAAFCIGK